jgi:hypothetical protein
MRSPSARTKTRSGVPADLDDVLRIVRCAIATCDEEGYSDEAIVTALLTEAMPRVIGSYGPTAVAIILRYVQGKLGVVEEPLSPPN